MVVLLPKVKVDYYTAWIVWARCQRVLGSLPWCLHEGAPALRMEGCITMSPAVTLHSLLSLSGRFKVLNIIFPREDDLFLSLWSSLPTLPSILKIARLSGTQPQVLQLLFLLCGRKNLQFGGGGGGEGAGCPFTWTWRPHSSVQLSQPQSCPKTSPAQWGGSMTTTSDILPNNSGKDCNCWWKEACCFVSAALLLCYF